MADKKVVTYVIIGLIIVGAIFMFQKGDLFKAKPTVPAGTSQGGLSLSACVIDKPGGECIGTEAQTQSVVTFEGEQPIVGARFVGITSNLLAIGNVPEINIIGFTGSPPEYGLGIQNQMTTSFILPQGASDVQRVDLDFTSENIPYGLTEFIMLVDASFKDAQGNVVPVTPIPQATINILKEKDTCDDGTPWGECNPNNKPKYCEPGTLEDATAVPPTTYTQGQLIDKASICGCPDNYIVDPNDLTGDTCSANVCIDGTAVGECVSPEPDTNSRYCAEFNQPTIEACQQCGCTLDYWGNPYIGCVSPGALDGSDLCEYQDYTGDISVSIGSGGGAQSFVQFRTSDLNYGTTSAIAYTSTCGNELTSYGHNGGGYTSSSGSCSTYLDTILVVPIPCTISGATACYFGTKSGLTRLCWDKSAGGYDSRVFTIGDPDAVNVATSPNPIDSSKEVTCS